MSFNQAPLFIDGLRTRFIFWSFNDKKTVSSCGADVTPPPRVDPLAEHRNHNAYNTSKFDYMI
jgi:hypothetical protein